MNELPPRREVERRRNVEFGLIPMRWTVLNALGGLIWLAGIVYAKGATGLATPYAVSEGHNVAVGLAMGAMGLALLLWANLRSAN